MKNDHAKARLRKTRIAAQRGYEIFTVSACGVRDLAKGDEEFTNFATHDDFPRLVPKREVWIDERLFENEGIFSIANALARLRALEDGASEDRAYAAGTNVERALRERLVGVKYRAGRPHKRVPARLYDEHYVTLPDEERPIEVWRVAGCLVRSLYKTDYVEGGHGYVYSWVPKGEIWVEYDLDPAELPYIVAHEYLELRLMRDEALEYDRAHAICAEVEFALREGRGIKPLVAPGGDDLARDDLPRLAAPEVFRAVVKRHVKKSQ